MNGKKCINLIEIDRSIFFLRMFFVNFENLLLYWFVDNLNFKLLIFFMYRLIVIYLDKRDIFLVIWKISIIIFKCEILRKL